MRTFREFCSRWQEPLIWLPIAVGALLAARWYLPQLDPSAGIDGLGVLYGLASSVLTFAVAAFVAWLAQVTYGTDLTDEQRDALLLCGTWQSFVVLALPWLQWFAVFILVWWKMS